MPSDQKIEYRGSPLPGRRGSTTDLTEKQQRFVEHFLIDLNATHAAVKAGYSEKSAGQQGSAMLKNPKVAATIEAGKQARAERTAVTQDWVVERLRENVERAMQHSPVLDSLGRETGEYTYQGGVANQALALLAKHTGVFSDKVEHGVTPGQRRVKFIMELASDD